MRQLYMMAGMLLLAFTSFSQSYSAEQQSRIRNFFNRSGLPIHQNGPHVL